MLEWIWKNTGGLLCILPCLLLFYLLWMEAWAHDRENAAKPKPKKAKR
jgi:hypothetical protein